MVDKELARYYCKDFWEEEGWVSCFECDIIFYDLEKLYEHQLIHLKEEKKKAKDKVKAVGKKVKGLKAKKKKK